MDTLLVEVVKDEGTVQRIFALRSEVFVLEQKVEPAEEFDGSDDSAVQIGAFLGKDLVGCGRIRMVEGKAKLERIAVLSRFRRRGNGGKLLESMIRIADGMGHPEQYLHSQLSVQGFYEKHSFVPVGEVFIEAGIPHIKMVLRRR